MKKLGTLLIFALAATTAGIAYAQDEAAPEASTAEDSAESPVTVAEVVVATSVEDHEPVGSGESFERGPSRLVCFVRVENPTRVESAVLVSWERAAGEPTTAERGVRLEVPASPRYRTFMRGTANREPGSYRCVARAEDGSVLGSADFEITG